MERKAATGTAVVTKEEVRSALGKVRTLQSDEEKVLRMRYGARVSEQHAPLPRAFGDNAELEDELLLIEMQLQKAWRMRLAETKKGAARPSPAKDKIVRALRRKK